MKYDSRSEADPIRLEQFVTWLTDTTKQDLMRCRGNRDQLRSAVFLYLNRAYEAHLDPGLVVELLGIGSGSILDAAGLDKNDEAVVMDSYEQLDATTFAVYRSEVGDGV